MGLRFCIQLCYNNVQREGGGAIPQRAEPIFVTKNGYGDLVVMSIETYEAMMENVAQDTAISEAEAEFERDGQLHDAREALASLRRKHFG